MMKEYRTMAEGTAQYNVDQLMHDVRTLLGQYKGKAQNSLAETLKNVLLGLESVEQSRVTVQLFDNPDVYERINMAAKDGTLEDFLTRAANIAIDSGDQETVATYARNYNGPNVDNPLLYPQTRKNNPTYFGVSN